MIPNWYFPVLQLGPLPVYVWGLFVAFGFLIATFLTSRRAPRDGFSRNDVWDGALWLLVGGFLGARLLYVVEFWGFYAGQPLEIFALWRGGLSSFGGFLGAVVALAWFVRRRQIPFRRYADLLAIHLPLGWFIGRFGCYSIHDHAGLPCTGALCVPFPDGSRRLDMGLIDGVGTLAVWFVMLAVARRQLRPGERTAALAIAYGIQRFALDFLRAGVGVDAGTPKYLSLTLAQYGSIALVVIGAVLIVCTRSSHSPPAPR